LIEDFEAPNVERSADNHRGWFHKDLSPKMAARTMQVMTTRLGGATFAGAYAPARLVSGQPLEAYSFTRPAGGTVVTMWNPYGPTDTSVVEVEAAGFVVYDANGQAVQTTAVGGSRVRL